MMFLPMTLLVLFLFRGKVQDQEQDDLYSEMV